MAPPCAGARPAPILGVRTLVNQPQRRPALVFHLRHGALPRILVGPPPQQLRAVPEAPSGEVVVLHFHHELRRERLELARPLRAPAAGPAWRPARKSRSLSQRLQLFREGALFARRN